MVQFYGKKDSMEANGYQQLSGYQHYSDYELVSFYALEKSHWLFQ